MNWQLLESDEEVQALLARAADCEAVALDTEFMRRNTYYPIVSLVQLCLDSEPDIAWLVDPLKLADTAPLQAFLSDTSVVKVLHSASEDLEVFQRWLGVLPQPLFDTQRAAALLNIGFGMGYRALVHELTGADLPKGETRSDWLARPLSDSQCEYAAMDVTWLLRLWQHLGPAAREQGKYDWVLADAANAVAQAQKPVQNTYLRIKGAAKLGGRQLAALRAICDWREQTAQTRDKPRGWIIDDRVCLQLAQQEPRDEHHLRQVPDLPPAVLRRSGRTLLALLEDSRALSESDWPPALPQPLGAAQRDRLKRLKSCARDLAAELAVTPEALLQSKDYELLIREAAGEEVVAPPHWSGWRSEAVVRPLRRQLMEMAS